jgi:NAD(P)-dependent dehydrogenase (short-subunit alcohol dehydrogenase family)
MTQTQDAEMRADKRPSAIVVGVGAEQGLGAALCRRFAAQGYHVFVAGRTSSKIDQVAHTIADAGGSAEAIVTDTTSEGGVARLFERAMARRVGLLPVDLVAYNAGNNRRIDFQEMTARLIRRFLAGRLLRRLPGWARSRTAARPAWPRHGHLHRCFSKPAR